MVNEERNAVDCGHAPLSLVTRYVPEDSYVCGQLWTRAGWYYWWEARAPDGGQLSGQMTGPFDEEGLALNAAEASRLSDHAYV